MHPHLFTDISSHGFGHLAQAAPVLNALQTRLPELRLTIRCALPEEKLRSRIHGAFELIPGSSDFGFAMLDAVRIDYATSAQRYRDFHADWANKVEKERRLFAALRPDLVLTDVAYLPLAGAARAGIRSVSMCSLNWGGLFAHYYEQESWAGPILDEILAAYRSVECFLRLMPAMPMPELPRTRALAPVAALGTRRRAELCERLGVAVKKCIVLVAYGGFDCDLQAARWPQTPGLCWLIPQAWGLQRADMRSIESCGLPFTDLLASVDAVLTKPGYGTFTEATCNGTPVLYQRRDNWPEQDCLIDWLAQHGRCREVDPACFLDGRIERLLSEVLAETPPARPLPEGAAEAAELLVDWLKPQAE